MAVAIFAVVGVFHTAVTILTDPVIVTDPSKWQCIVYVVVYPCELILVSISLFFAYVYLSVNIKKHFARELQDEGKRIRAIFVFFALSYISRAVVYVLVQV